MEKEFEHFVRNFQSCVNKNTTMKLITSHGCNALWLIQSEKKLCGFLALHNTLERIGRVKQLLFYAQLIKDNETVCAHIYYRRNSIQYTSWWHHRPIWISHYHPIAIRFWVITFESVTLIRRSTAWAICFKYPATQSWNSAIATPPCWCASPRPGKELLFCAHDPKISLD